MAGKFIKLSSSQKDEIRRLTQLANRRIKAAEKAYSKEGKSIVPSEIAGPYQTKERWNTKSTPISRSVKFESEQAYKEQLKFLRSFDPKATRVARPGIKEYTRVQAEKTAQAVETALGSSLNDDLQKKLSKMTAPQLAEFWNTFSDKASRLGLNYSSEAVMDQTMNEIFPEDMRRLAS